MSAIVVCLHASGSSGSQWTPLRERLGTSHRVLAPDLHGHGGGPAWNAARHDIFTADVALVGRLVAGVPGDLHLVGHSYGGAVAIRTALAHPARVRSVALYEPVMPRMLFDEAGVAARELADVARAMAREIEEGDATAAAARFVDYWSGHGAWHELSAHQQDGLVRRVRLFVAQFRSAITSTPSLAECRALRVPVLLMAGGALRAPVRRVRELLHTAMPHATVESLPALGHMGPLTAPALVAHRVADFIAAHATRLGTMWLRPLAAPSRPAP